MNKRKNSIVIDGANSDIIRVGTLNYNNQLAELEYYVKFQYSRGSIHTGIIRKIFPSLQAVFVQYMEAGKNGFLSFSEISQVYFSDSNEFNNRDKVQEQIIDETLDVTEEGDLTYSSLENERSAESSYIRGRGFLYVGQQIIVQVTKEERGTKGAMLTTYIQLEGKFCTLVVNRPDRTAIASNINFNLIDKKRLQLLLQNINIPENSSIIMNQAGFNASKNEIDQDVAELSELWQYIKNKAFKRIQETQAHAELLPVIIYYQFNLLKEIFQNRRINSNQYLQNIIIEGEETYSEAVNFAKNSMPNLTSTIKYYNINEEKIPIFTRYGIERSVESILSPIVSLKSGGYIVINRTEALVAIDVNSGKNRDENSIEDTALKTNIEAVQEAMNQIRLRKISGLVVLDLIGMREAENNRIIEGIAWRMAQFERTKIQIILVQELSILVISKQRLENSLYDICQTHCQNCGGNGYVKNARFNTQDLFNAIRNYVALSRAKEVKVFVNQAFFEVLLNEYRDGITSLSHKLDCSINFSLDVNLSACNYRIERLDKPIEKPFENPIEKKVSEETSISLVLPDSKTITLSEENLSPKEELKKEKGARKTTEEVLNLSDISQVWNEWMELNFKNSYEENN